MKIKHFVGGEWIVSSDGELLRVVIAVFVAAKYKAIPKE